MKKSGKTILILDDTKFIRDSFVDYFEDNAWNVFNAGSAELALEILQSESLDCAVVDVRLPGMDGNEFILRANKIKPNLVFVVCTGSPEYNFSAELLEMKVVSDELFRKPVVDLSLLENNLLMVIDSLNEKKVIDE